ncbi:hypothetical protein BKA83DRAFT_4121808 [Pisolithus microcarpus]|nr:hypothetical protein BKA83DRAFT_4121808 [Pisolithus microcarpus]
MQGEHPLGEMSDRRQLTPSRAGVTTNPTKRATDVSQQLHEWDRGMRGEHLLGEMSDRCQLTPSRARVTTNPMKRVTDTINDGVVKALNALVPPLRVFSVFMARTKQTAGKTTCGAAPRVEFFHPTHTAFSKAASRAMESTSSLSSLTTAPSSRAPSPDSTGETALEQWDTNRYCYLCHDGGKFLFACNTCPRVVCQRCLGLREDLMKKVCAVDTNFHCPGCHELRDGASKRNLTPYFAFTRNVHGKTIHVLDQPVIMSSVCERASKSQQKKLNRWRVKAKKLGAKLGASDFKRKIIFVTVHSEVTRGDLFSGKDEKGGDVAMRVEEFMSCLFSPPLEEVVYASTLFMLTCGPLVSFQESFTSMQQSIRQELSSSLVSLQPEYTIAFTALNFINAVLKPFLVSYGVQVLIEGHALGDVLQDLLNVSLGLRMHSDVILFHVAGLISSKAPFLLRRASLATTPLVTGYRYSWYHSHRRPWGNSLPIGCKKCAAIRPWGRSKLDPQPDQPKARVTKCQSKGCDFEVRTQPLPHEYQVLRGDETSGWLKYVICAAEPL